MRQVGIFISLFFAGMLLLPSAQAQTDLVCEEGNLSEKLLFSRISHDESGQINFHQVRLPGTLPPEEKVIPHNNKDKNPNKIHIILSSGATGVYLQRCEQYVAVGFMGGDTSIHKIFIIVPTTTLFDEYKAYLGSMKKLYLDARPKSLIVIPPS